MTEDFCPGCGMTRDVCPGCGWCYQACDCDRVWGDEDEWDDDEGGLCEKEREGEGV